MNYKTLLLACLVTTSVCAKSDKILDMIRRIDPYGLNELHIPGFFIKAAEKKRYEEAAREVTDKAYRYLHTIALYDFVRLVKGALKGATSAGALYGLYLYATGKLDASWLAPGHDKSVSNCKTYTLTDGRTYPWLNKWSVSGALAGLATYFFLDAKNEFANIYSKQQRVLAYHNALAQEAYIRRLPVCDVGACETVLDD